tara:strand:- start:700 stop:873 length:174 start_codon:yes stop_codon:yes gene_type:complete
VTQVLLIAYSHGAIAQLGERLHGMQEVGGSIPPSSTNLFGIHLFLYKCIKDILLVFE